MRILAISDIHNNVSCVRKLRAQETNRYDAIAIPGDIGTQEASEIFKILGTFKCPVLYVHGNWDHMPENAKFGRRTHLVHLKAVKVGKLAFAGYSFDGSLPLRLAPGAGFAEYKRQCRTLVRAALEKAGIDLQRCVLMTHDRATYVSRDFPNLLLHLYGHIHTFDITRRDGTTYVNASALDRVTSVTHKSNKRVVRFVNVGNYAVIEVNREGAVSVECRLLSRNYENWNVTGDWITSSGLMDRELIPEDLLFK